MARENIVLSLNPDDQKLQGQGSILRDKGFEIIFAATPLQARFEIEMGRCGIFLTSYITPFAIYRDLANLFRRSCPNGLVIFLMEVQYEFKSAIELLAAPWRCESRCRWFL